MNGFMLKLRSILIDRHRHLLAARAAEGGVDIADGIDGRVGHRMQAVGDLHADVAGPGVARLLAALPTTSSPADGAFRARAR